MCKKKTKTVFLEMKTAKCEMKNTMEEINGTLNITGKKTSKLEDTAMYKTYESKCLKIIKNINSGECNFSKFEENYKSRYNKFQAHMCKHTHT